MPTATPFNNLITFSRGSNATVTGSNGLIQYAPNNLLTNSEQFDNAAWVKTAVTATANSTVAPNGTTTADTITASAGAGYHYAAQNAAVVAGTTYTASMYVRAGTARYIGFGDAGDAVWHSAYLDTTDGSILNQVNCVATAVSVGGGWFLVTSTFTRTNAVNAQIYVGGSTVTGSAGPLFTAAGTETCIAWGAQLELGSTATTYNPTTVKNLLGFSEAFDNAAWTKTNSSIVTGAQANPVNGLFNAQKLMENTATGARSVSQNASVLANTPYVGSVYLKSAGRTWCALELGSLFGFTFAYFNLLTGEFGTTNNSPSLAATSLGNGWWRVSIGKAPTSSGSTSFSIYTAAVNGTASYTGDGNSGVYIYGAQLSDSASLDPYVPTPGAAPSSTAFYGPRFDFDPVTLQPRGLLVEEQRTNLLVRSEELENASWDKTASVTTNQLVSPGGSTTGDLVSTTANFQYVRQLITATASAQYTATFFVKPVTGSTTIRIMLTNGPQTEYAGSNFGLTGDGSLGTTFTTGTGVLVGRSITKLADGWYRCSVTATNNTTSLYSLIDNHAGGTMSFGVWGAQLEAGAFATSYIPTVASTVTRSADVATITGQNFAQWYRQDEGAFVALFDSYLVDTNTRSALSAYAVGATSNNILLINAVQRQFQINNAGNQADLDGGTPATGAVIKAVGAYRLNDFALSLDAGSVVTDTTGTVPTVDALGIGVSSLGLTPVNGHIRNIRFIPARAADFQLQALST